MVADMCHWLVSTLWVSSPRGDVDVSHMADASQSLQNIDDEMKYTPFLSQ